jgi:acyl-CoA synthetase (AMP-forming)/AMP-acid ligase II
MVFVVPARERALDRPGLLATCRAKLGSDVDVELRVVGALPRNPNGKVLRSALRADPTRGASG